MEYFKRALTQKLLAIRDKLPVVTLYGPRQSGKTTLLRMVYNDLPYISLEELDNRAFANNDPRGFLDNYKQGAIIDEVHHSPGLLSYIQTKVDTEDIFFALSSSQNMLLSERVSQSLAGRTAIFQLLPLSLDEIKLAGKTLTSFEEACLQGGYPRVLASGLNPEDFYPSYYSTYIERDVRQIKNIGDLAAFANFMKLCAGRIGQPLNYASLATDSGISPNTAKSWISILQSTYIVYLLQPYYQNFNKRLIKSPKLYFHDTGVACQLLGIQTDSQISTHYLKGGLFENLVISEYLKRAFNNSQPFNGYYWQSKEGREVDLIIESGGTVQAIEIKSGKTRNEHFFENLNYWNKLAPEIMNREMTVIYGGDSNMGGHPVGFRSWREIF